MTKKFTDSLREKGITLKALSDHIGEPYNNVNQTVNGYRVNPSETLCSKIDAAIGEEKGYTYSMIIGGKI